MSSPTGSIPPSTPGPRIALIGLNQNDAAFLCDCFRQFKLPTIVLTEDPELVLRREKFSGCVVPLEKTDKDKGNTGAERDPAIESILKAARQSPSNRHMLIYGVAADTSLAMRYSDYGINVMFRLPLERPAALKLVRSTYLLAMHEFRRYVRVPVATEVQVEADGEKISTLSDEISNGGMSLCTPNLLPGKSIVRVTFKLPGQGTISIMATICWRRDPERSFGVQFFADDPGRQMVRKWIDSFLELE
jgi:hypothetical protein